MPNLVIDMVTAKLSAQKIMTGLTTKSRPLLLNACKVKQNCLHVTIRSVIYQAMLFLLCKLSMFLGTCYQVSMFLLVSYSQNILCGCRCQISIFLGTCYSQVSMLLGTCYCQVIMFLGTCYGQISIFLRKCYGLVSMLLGTCYCQFSIYLGKCYGLVSMLLGTCYCQISIFLGTCYKWLACWYTLNSYCQELEE